MVARNYSSIAPAMVLQANMSDSATTLVVDQVAGLPPVPFIISVDFDQVGEEVCLVTAISGTTLTVTRAQGDTTAIAHGLGAPVRHTDFSGDFQDSQDHINANSGVHGTASRVVGETDTQVLQNKTIDGSLNTLSNVPGSSLVTTGSVPKSVLPSDTVYTGATQTLTGKTLTAPAITSPTGLVKADVGLGNVDNTSNATERAAAATLANKAISGSTNTLTNLPGANIVGANSVPKSVLPADAAYSTWTTVSGGSAVDAQTNYLDNTTVVKYNTGLRLVQINAKFTLSAGTLTANANGGVTDAPTVKLVTGLAAILPTDRIYGVGEYNGVEIGVYLDTAGNVTLFQGSPNLVISSGTGMTASLFYTY